MEYGVQDGRALTIVIAGLDRAIHAFVPPFLQFDLPDGLFFDSPVQSLSKKYFSF
jgi:hypothetical protein